MKCRCGQKSCYKCGVSNSNEPICQHGLGLEVEDEDDESNDGSVARDDEEAQDEDKEESAEDRAQREVLRQAGIHLAWSDLARIRAEGIVWVGKINNVLPNEESPRVCHDSSEMRNDSPR